MKKALFTVLLAMTAAAAGAQTMYDGLTFSQNNYYGTARSIGMGNAMTAVGGDLGSIGINPAGSAVAGYSQFTITPNLTISSMNASYSAYPVDGPDKFINEQGKSLTRFSLPNIGATFNWKTGSRSGLKSITYGFIINGTNNFTGQMMAGGRNDRTSYISSMAIAADGYDMDFLNGYSLNSANERIDRGWDYPYYYQDDFTNDPNKGTYAPWNVIANAQAGAVSNYGDTEDPAYYWRYIGATGAYENTGRMDEYGNYIYRVYLPGALNQSYGRKVTGSKYDALLNVGLNFSETFFIGVNLGVTTLNYDYDEYFKEAAENPSEFGIDFGEDGKTNFSDYRSRYSYTAEGSGVYGKFGFLWRPVDGIRIGGAVQTPTVMEISERWKHSVNVNYTNQKFNGSADTPEGDYTYRLRSPYRVNVGAAFTFAGMALWSADYEMADYSTMKFMSKDSGWDDAFEAVNNEIKDCMGVSHSVRIGAEFKPLPEFAVRAGYNFTTTPEYFFSDGKKTTLNDTIHSFSVGIGYSSSGSFFADIAARMTALTDEYITPYADYLDDTSSPMILNKRDIYSVTATFGWRF